MSYEICAGIPPQAIHLAHKVVQMALNPARFRKEFSSGKELYSLLRKLGISQQQ